MSRNRYVLFATLVGSVALVGLGQAATASPCDPAFVRVQHKTVLVLPTGGDDTANLQCALDLGATRGPGAAIQLSAGTFYTAQLVIDGLRGVVRGMGQKRTIVHNLDVPLPIDHPCLDAGPCFADAPPAADNRYPALISVIGRDVVLSDMTFDIVGTHVVEPWRMWGFPIDGFSEIVQFIGSHAALAVTRVTFRGAPILPDEQGVWGGTSVAILMWSFSRPWNVTGSAMVVTDSVFNTGGGVNAFNLERSLVAVTRNRFALADYGTATAVSDWRDSSILFDRNEFVPAGAGVTGFFGFPGNLGTGITRSELFVANNSFVGEVGIQFLPGSFHNVFCLAVNNDMSQVTTPYVMDGSTPCRIVEKKAKP